MRSKWSHSFLVLEHSQFGDTYVSETSDFHVNISTLARYCEAYDKTVEIYNPVNLSVEQMRAIILDSRKRDGMVYGYGQLISLGIRRLILNYFKKDIGNFIRWNVVCNSHVGYAYKVSGLPEFQADPEAIDTEEFYQIVKASPNFKLAFSKEAKK